MITLSFRNRLHFDAQASDLFDVIIALKKVEKSDLGNTL